MSKTISVLKLYIVLEQRILYPLILQGWQLDINSGVAMLLVKYAYISSWTTLMQTSLVSL
jgi:hypothetical protein